MFQCFEICLTGVQVGEWKQIIASSLSHIFTEVVVNLQLASGLLGLVVLHKNRQVYGPFEFSRNINSTSSGRFLQILEGSLWWECAWEGGQSVVLQGGTWLYILQACLISFYRYCVNFLLECCTLFCNSLGGQHNEGVLPFTSDRYEVCLSKLFCQFQRGSHTSRAVRRVSQIAFNAWWDILLPLW